MSSFEFYSVPRIRLGRGQVARLGEIARQFGTRALIVHSAGPETIARVTELLSVAGVWAGTLRQRGEPAVADVDRSVDFARQEHCELVIGLGGGSALDTAKAVAGLLTNGGSALDYMEIVGAGRKLTLPGVPFVALPTTAGTGAEATRNAVIGHPEKRFKASIRSEHLLARVAIVDPELALPVRPEITARSGMDALCQLIESYTSTGANPITDALALQGIPLAARHLLRAYEDGQDLEAREAMAMAALLSGITLTNAGLGAAHGFAAPLGANFPIPHGTICGVLLPHVIAANIQALRSQSPHHPVLRRYATIGRLLAGQPALADDHAAEATVRCAAELVSKLGLPPLGQFGLTTQQIPEMTALARKSSSMRYNPVSLSDDALTEILRQASV